MLRWAIQCMSTSTGNISNNTTLVHESISYVGQRYEEENKLTTDTIPRTPIEKQTRVMQQTFVETIALCLWGVIGMQMKRLSGAGLRCAFLPLAHHLRWENGCCPL